MFNQIKKLIKEGKNLFITGGGGVGKSYLLNKLSKQFKITVTSTTGISALNVGGQTLHSWAGVGICSKSIFEVVNTIKKNKWKLRQISNTKILAIDEISMLDNYTFEYIDMVLRRVLENKKPFGGIQVILIGDFFQLPPVQLGTLKQGKEIDFCFNSPVWKELNLETINLTKTYRQTDKKLIQSLNEIRLGDNENTKLFEKRNFITPPSKNCIRLYATNQEVDSYNKKCFDEIDKPIYTYIATDTIRCYINQRRLDLNPNDNRVSSKDKQLYETFNQNCKAQYKINLKETCRVMLLQNMDVENGLVNGSCGEVKELNDFGVLIQFDNGIKRYLEPVDFELVQYDEVKIKRRQLPLMLAYSCSIHKSQGMTFDKVFIDFKRIFTFGQAYVGLSRVKTLDGLFLSNFDSSKIQASKEVVNFYKNLLGF